MQRYQFVSDEWISELRDELEAGLQGVDIGNLDFVLCEEYTNPPDHLQDAITGTAAFHIQIKDGNVLVAKGSLPAEETSYKIIADYEAIRQMAVLTHAQAAAEGINAQERAAELVRTGQLQVLGDMGLRPETFTKVNLHDRMAPKTC
jgi:hypothetical protein